MPSITTLRAAGDTSPGLQRQVNEDRFHVDVARGLFMVIDGVGGQAAGGKAADTAVSVLRAHLERETRPIAARLRDAIAVANNEIYRLAGLRTEWNGMACVLTAVAIDDGHAIVGHVGDTRLYKLHDGRIEKVTRDHSPVGEREDARELSEIDAMQHPRRNEVYRDVGSEPHEPTDPDFIDIDRVPFEPDAALLLCSDGLTDLVDSSSINEIVSQSAGQPQRVVKTLIDAANAAGGKDNVTVVYVEGEQFAPPAIEEPAAAAEITRRLGPAVDPASSRRRGVRFANVLLAAVLILLTFVRSDSLSPRAVTSAGTPAVVTGGRIVVHANESITEALQNAPEGATVVVDPGEYRETVVLKSSVRLISRDPGRAVIRLPGAAAEGAAAVVARGVTDAAIQGFRIIGDAATPLGTGVLAVESQVAISEIEITGAAHAAIDVRRSSRVRVVAAEIRDNPGAALAVRSGSTATVSHSEFARNGSGPNVQKPLIFEDRGTAHFTANVFVGSGPSVFTGSSEARAAFARNNWFPETGPSSPPRPAPRGR
jgi:serine/threonine protein phosphatase PrpC